MEHSGFPSRELVFAMQAARLPACVYSGAAPPSPQAARLRCGGHLKEATMTRGLAKLRQKFSTQRSDAKRRGIGFRLTFDEWLGIWRASGRLAQRGNRRGRYVMARQGDRGAYAVGNVKIIRFEKNAQEYRPTLAAKTATGLAHRGKIVSAKTRRKLSQVASNRTYSTSTRLKMSRSARRTAVFRDRDDIGRFA